MATDDYRPRRAPILPLANMKRRHDDDMVRLNLSVGAQNIPLKAVGLEWPPPERLYLGTKEEGGLRPATDDDDPTCVLVRQTVSIITDEQRAEMTHVFRGANYAYAVEV